MVTRLKLPDSIRFHVAPDAFNVNHRMNVFALADQLEARLAKARGQLEKLTPALLARAFRSQVVPETRRNRG